MSIYELYICIYNLFSRLLGEKLMIKSKKISSSTLIILCNVSLLLITITMLGCSQEDYENKKSDAEVNNISTAQSEQKKTGKVLARVNGSPIYEDDLRGRNLKFVLAEEIIYQAGLKEGVDSSIKDQVKRYEKTLVIKNVKSNILENAEPTKKISDEEIQEYYELNKHKYTYYKVREITFPDLALGEEIKEKAKNEDNLNDIANSYPDLTISVMDVDFNRSMLSRFENTQVGSVSEVIQKPSGTYGILKIVETKERPLSASKRSIRHILESIRKAELFENYSDRAAEEYNIKVEIID